MAALFLDSSALARLYHEEAGSTVVEKLVRGATATLLISRLSVVEVQSAFAGKVRSGVISADDAAGLRRRFLEDIASGVLKVVAVDNLVAADKVLCKVAAIEGMQVTDPESGAL